MPNFRSLPQIMEALQGLGRPRPFGPIGQSEIPAVLQPPFMGPPRPPPPRSPLGGVSSGAQNIGPGGYVDDLFRGQTPGASTGLFQPPRTPGVAAPPVLPPSATPSGFIPWFNQNVNPNRVMLPIAGAAGLGALGFSAMDLGQQQTEANLLQPQGQSPAPIGKTPAEQELEAYMKEIMGYQPPMDTDMPSLSLSPPSPMNLGPRPELLSKIQELKQYGPGAEGMLTPEDKWQFILGGLAQGAAASGGDDLGDMLFKMGAGMLAGSSKYGLTRREQEGQKAKEDRDWKRQLAQLEASAMANEYGMDLTRAKLEREEDVYKNSLGLAKYNADTSRLNATRSNPAQIYSNATKAKVGALDKDPILGSEVIQFVPPGEVARITSAEDWAPPMVRGLDEKTQANMTAQMIWEKYCAQNPGQCRDIMARYKLNRISKALGGG